MRILTQINKISRFFIFLIFLCIFSPLHFVVNAKNPVLTDQVTYWSPEWFGNDRIIYIKEIEHKKHSYGLLADISKGGSVLIGEDYQICTADLDGKNEQVIRTFSMKRPLGWDANEVWTDDFFKGKGYRRINTDYLSYNPRDNLIALTYAINEAQKIIVLTADGKKIWQIDVGGINPKISPDGKRILYHQEIRKNIPGPYSNVSTEKSIWLVNIDGTDNRKIVDNATNGIWHPDGEKILFSRDAGIKYMPIFNEYLLNLKTQEITLFEVEDYMPIQWLTDGKKIFTTGGFFDIETKKHIFIKNLPNGPRISPDGERIIGDPVNIEGRVGIVNIDGTNLRKIFDNYHITIK